MGSNLIEEALGVHPDVKAIIVTYPNYYGIGEDLTEMVRLAHQKGDPCAGGRGTWRSFSVRKSVFPSRPFWQGQTPLSIQRIKHCQP
ncbi:hypothetical protein RCO48_09530 [Peribacillus frigoritolerans]|nr:hypothetical protein [Peribacillus frigoritolerans]